MELSVNYVKNVYKDRNTFAIISGFTSAYSLSKRG